MTRKARRPDTIRLFAHRIQKFMWTLERMGLAETDDLQSINKARPREVFARFMAARIQNVTVNK